MNKKTVYVTESGIIAAVYILLTYLQAVIFPSSVFSAIQFRLSEFLMVLCIYRSSAVAGLTIGCMIANIANAALPIDIVMGAAATLLAGISMYALRNIRFFKLPVLALFMPAIFNGLIIGFEISFFLTDAFNWQSFLICSLQVFIGEAAVMLCVGLPFTVYFEKGKWDKRIFK